MEARSNWHVLGHILKISLSPTSWNYLESSLALIITIVCNLRTIKIGEVWIKLPLMSSLAIAIGRHWCHLNGNNYAFRWHGNVMARIFIKRKGAIIWRQWWHWQLWLRFVLGLGLVPLLLRHWHHYCHLHHFCHCFYWHQRHHWRFMGTKGAIVVIGCRWIIIVTIESPPLVLMAQMAPLSPLPPCGDPDWYIAI